MTKIPKTIHYCWFSEKEMPEQLKECIKSWEILKKCGYKIICWNEANCSFDENDFVRKAYAEKRWGFIGDYYRCKALYEYGGVYLDTDVVIHKSFDELLDNHCFIGYSCDCAFCTAVIGSEKKGSLIKGVLEMYNNSRFISKATFFGENDGENPYSEGRWIPSNEFWTWYMIKRYSGLSMNNKEKIYTDVHIYPKQYFELGSLFGKYYSRHLNYNSWRKNSKNSYLRRIKKKIENNTSAWIIIRRIKSQYCQKKTNFFKCKQEIRNEYDRLNESNCENGKDEM